MLSFSRFGRKVGVGEMISGKESGADLLDRKFSFHGLFCADFLPTNSGGMTRDVAKCARTVGSVDGVVLWSWVLVRRIGEADFGVVWGWAAGWGGLVLALWAS